MCGGCGRREAVDWLGPALSPRRTRQTAAGAVTALLGDGRGRVDAVDAGYVVRGATGRSVVAATLDAVWAAVLRGGDVAVPDRPPSPATTRDPAHDPCPDLCPDLEAPSVHAGAVVLAVCEDPTDLSRAWGADRVLAGSTPEVVAEALGGAPVPRTLVWASPRTPGVAESALDAVATPLLRLRTTITAVVRDGEGPSWATDLHTLDRQARRRYLDGRRDDLAPVPGLDVGVAAAWLSGLVAVGATAGRAVGVRTADGRVLEAVHGRGVALRGRAQP